MKRPDTFPFMLDESFPHLAAAPIEEAVIHWVARAANTLEGEAFQKGLTERLPDYPECQRQHQLEMGAQIDTQGASTQFHRQSFHGFRFVSADKRNIGLFTRDGLVFSRLKPYENWNAFSAEGRRLWHIFVGIAAPTEVQRLGVRFINRIVPIDRGHMGRYLTKPPRCLEPIGLPMTGYLYQSVHEVPGHPFLVNVVQTIQQPAPPQTEAFGLILDIDVATTKPFHPTDQHLDECLAKMRWLKNKAFFSLIPKKLCKSLGEGNL